MTHAYARDALGGKSVQRAVSIREQVAALIREAMAELRFKPGDLLVERDLCEATGASRTTVREALRQLEAEGLTTSIPGRGTAVVKLEEEDATNIYEIRAALEGLAGRLFAERATDDELQELASVVDKMEQSKSDVKAVLGAKSEFYDVLFSGARNPELSKMIDMIHRRVTLLRSLSLSMPNRVEESVRELKEIVAAAERRDGDGMYELCVAHVHAAAQVALEGIRKS